MKSDYLKYWRVVRYYLKSKYGLNQADLDMIFFLYSESYFSKDKFSEFNELLSWDVKRFDRLLRDGWIEVFRKRAGKHKALYELSYKAKRMCAEAYKKLNGDEISMNKSNNSMFLKNVNYNDKVYRNMIKEMNKERKSTRLQQRPSPE